MTCKQGENISSKERYNRNRDKVCEIYGVNPDRCSCHHIIQRSDAKDPTSVFFGYDVDQLSNLYPFPIKDVEEHYRTHRLIEAQEGQVAPPPRKYRKQTIYKAPKQRLRKKRRK